MEVASGVLSSQDTTDGTATLDIGAIGTLSLLQGATSGQAADFLASTGSLDLSIRRNFQDTIAGFGSSNQIDLINAQDGSTTVASLHFTGSYTQSNFVSVATAIRHCHYVHVAGLL